MVTEAFSQTYSQIIVRQHAHKTLMEGKTLETFADIVLYEA